MRFLPLILTDQVGHQSDPESFTSQGQGGALWVPPSCVTPLGRMHRLNPEDEIVIPFVSEIDCELGAPSLLCRDVVEGSELTVSLCEATNVLQVNGFCFRQPLPISEYFSGPTELVSASSDEYPHYAWRAYDGDTIYGWRSANIPSNDEPEYITREFPTPRLFVGCRISHIYSNTSGFPRDFSIQGSMDQLSWDTLLTVSNETQPVGYPVGEPRDYAWSIGREYKYYRILVTRANGDTKVMIGEIEWFEAEVGNSRGRTLRSAVVYPESGQWLDYEWTPVQVYRDTLYVLSIKCRVESCELELGRDFYGVCSVINSDGNVVAIETNQNLRSFCLRWSPAVYYGRSTGKSGLSKDTVIDIPVKGFPVPFVSSDLVYCYLLPSGIHTESTPPVSRGEGLVSRDTGGTYIGLYGTDGESIEANTRRIMYSNVFNKKLRVVQDISCTGETKIFHVGSDALYTTNVVDLYSATDEVIIVSIRPYYASSGYSFYGISIDGGRVEANNIMTSPIIMTRRVRAGYTQVPIYMYYSTAGMLMYYREFFNSGDRWFRKNKKQDGMQVMYYG